MSDNQTNDDSGDDSRTEVVNGLRELADFIEQNEVPVPRRNTNATAELLTPLEVAELLRVNISTVYRRIREGTLPAVRLGYAPQDPLRIPADELHAQLYGGR
jgi:excisionase family DNA binding protein